MKKTTLLATAALAVLAVSAQAQVSTRWDKQKPFSAQSTIANFDWNRVDLGYIHDGKNASYTGLYTPAFRFDSLDIDAGPLLARDSNNQQVNLGLFLTKSLYDKNGFGLRVGAGFKGYDFNGGSFATGRDGAVFGVFLTIKK